MQNHELLGELNWLLKAYMTPFRGLYVFAIIVLWSFISLVLFQHYFNQLLERSKNWLHPWWQQIQLACTSPDLNFIANIKRCIKIKLSHETDTYVTLKTGMTWWLQWQKNEIVSLWKHTSVAYVRICAKLSSRDD